METISVLYIRNWGNSVSHFGAEVHLSASAAESHPVGLLFVGISAALIFLTFFVVAKAFHDIHASVWLLFILLLFLFLLHFQ